MQYMVSVRDDKLGKVIIRNTRTDEDGAKAIFHNFASASTPREQAFMRKLIDEGASTYQEYGGKYSVTAMRVDS